MKRLIVLVALPLLVLVLWPSGLIAAPSGWSRPVEVSDTREDSKYGRVAWFPDLAIGPDDSVHVIWGSGISTTGEAAESIDLLMYRELRNGVWSQVNDIAFASKGGYTVRNGMVMSRDGRLHVLMRNGTVIREFSTPWEQGLSAQAWSEPRLISGKRTAYYDALATDSKGALHALWSESVSDDPKKPNKDCSLCSDMFYRRSIDGGEVWSEPVNLSQTLDGENRPQMKIDQQDRIHVVWDEGIDWYAGKGKPRVGVYRRSDDGGKTWSPPVYFIPPKNAAAATPTVAPGAAAEPPEENAVQQTALALTKQGEPFVVYRTTQGDQLYFQQSSNNGTAWSAPVAIPGVLARDLNDNNLDAYSMVTDSAGRIHLLMVGFRSDSSVIKKNPSLWHLTWDGRRWSLPEAVMDNDLYPEWPRLAIFNGNHLHAVWFTRHKSDLYGSEHGSHYQVWYSSEQIGAPSATALPLFTPTPTLAPTETALPAPPMPSPEPLAPAVVQAMPLNERPGWEAPGLRTVAMAVLPTLGLVLLCGSITWWLRRRD